MIVSTNLPSGLIGHKCSESQLTEVVKRDMSNALNAFVKDEVKRAIRGSSTKKPVGFMRSKSLIAGE